jgi:Flp pilus assembly CpaF family ATPase
MTKRSLINELIDEVKYHGREITLKDLEEIENEYEELVDTIRGIYNTLPEIESQMEDNLNTIRVFNEEINILKLDL